MTKRKTTQKKVLYESATKREKAIKSQIGHLLKFYKCGIDENIFLESYQNYYGFKIELKYLPKCNAWNDFLLRCTWRKQINPNDAHYIYSKYKSQYPHIFAMKQCFKRRRLFFSYERRRTFTLSRFTYNGTRALSTDKTRYT